MLRPGNEKLANALHFNFQVINNETKYEALLTGLNLANSIGVEHLDDIRGDLQLIINQITRQFQIKGENMQAYVNEAIDMIKNFKMVTLTLIP